MYIPIKDEYIIIIIQETSKIAAKCKPIFNELNTIRDSIVQYIIDGNENAALSTLDTFTKKIHSIYMDNESDIMESISFVDGLIRAHFNSDKNTYRTFKNK